MPNVDVRRCRAEDREGFARVRSMTYRGGRPISPDDELLGEGRIGYVALVEGEVCGAMTVLDMDCTRDGGAVPNGGVCAVGVLPHKRRLGVGSALMAASLRLMKEDGYASTSLYAYREPFYRQFDYEVCGLEVVVSCPVGRLPKVKDPLPVRQLGPSDVELVRPCYERFCKRYSGMNTRKRDAWWPAAGGEHPFTVYVAGDPVEAYMVLRVEPDFWCTQEIRELFWTSLRGYETLLDLMKAIGINKTHLKWQEPAFSPLYTRLLDEGIGLSVRRPLQYRILDVARCLSILRPHEAGRLAIQVHDRFLEENARCWRVEFGPDGTEAEPTAEAPDLELDIRSLTQAWLGEPSLDDLLAEGLAKPHNPAKLKEARALFRPCRVYCADVF